MVLMAACSAEQSADTGDESVFRFNIADGLGTLDPALMSYRAAIWAGTQMYNGLVQLDSSQRIHPCIAKSWQVDSSGTVWTFVLRDDVFFHTDSCFGSTGTRRVVSGDFKYSIERICDARVKSNGFWVYRERIRGAEDFHNATREGKASEGISGLQALDDTTLQITLNEPFPPFLAMLTMPYGYVVAREAFALYGESYSRHAVGTGPFMLERWQEDVELLWRRNPQYFEQDAAGTRLPYLDKVQATFLRDTEQEFLEFEQGNIDFIPQVDPAFAPAVFHESGGLSPAYARYKLLQQAAHSVEYYGIMLDEQMESARNLPLASRRKVRQALNYAVDREKIIRYVLHGQGIPAHYGVLPPGMPGFSKQAGKYRYDPELAGKLLAEAGFPGGKGLPPLTLQLGVNKRTAAVAEAVQQQWKEIGVELHIRQVDFPRHLDMVKNGKLPLWRTSWIGDYPDPENFLALFYAPYTAPKGPNTTHIARADLDSLYQAALSPRLSPEERYALYNQMESIVLEEAPWVFLYYNVLQRLAQPWISGLFVDGQDRLVLTRVKSSRGH